MERKTGRGKSAAKKPAYYYFVKALHAKFVKRHPEYPLNDVEFWMCGYQRWKAMSVRQRSTYRIITQDDKVAKMTPYALFVQALYFQLRIRHPDYPIDNIEFSICCSQKWEEMSSQQKAPYRNLAELEKQRRFSNETCGPAVGRKNKRGCNSARTKDPNEPKPPLSAFGFFCLDNRPRARAYFFMNRPKYEFTEDDVNKELDRRWAKTDTETKTQYAWMGERDKQRYKKEMAIYKINPKAPTLPAWTTFSVFCHPISRFI